MDEKRCLESEEGIDVVELFYKIKEVIKKNKKIIAIVFVIITLFSILIGIKIENKNKYIQSEIEIPYLKETKGKNFDGSKFNSDFLLNGRKDITLEVVVPEGDQFRINAGQQKKEEAYWETPTKYLIISKNLSREEMDKVIKQNISQYTEKEIAKKILKQYVVRKEALIENKNIKGSDEYSKRLVIFNWSVNSIEKVIKEVETNSYYVVKTDIELAKKDLGIMKNELEKYKKIINDNNYVENKEKVKKYYEEEIKKINDENLTIESNLQTLQKIVDTFKDLNQNIPLTFSFGKKNYQSILPEYGSLLLTYGENRNKIITNNKILKNIVEPSLKEKENIGIQEELLVDKISKYIDKFSPVINEYNKGKIENSIKVAPSILVKDKKAKMIIFMGPLLGIILGLALAILKEFYKKIKF